MLIKPTKIVFVTGAFLWVFGVWCLGPSVAFAHAVPLHYIPEANSSQSVLPESIIISFTERVEPYASSMKIYGPDGAEIPTPKAEVSLADPRALTVPLTGITSTGGVHTISWQVVSRDDGHFTQGAYSFAVGGEGGLRGGAPSVRMAGGVETTSSFAETFFTFLELLGHALMWGTFLSAGFLLPRFREELALEWGGLEKKIILLFSLGAVTLVLGSCAHFSMGAVRLAALQASTFTEALGVFATTSNGQALVIMAVATLPIFFLRRFIFSRQAFGWFVLFILLIVITVVRAKVSHASASLFHPYLSVGVNVIHLLAKNAWTGVLLSTSVVILPLLLSKKETLKKFLPQLSLLFTYAFLGVGLSGVYIVWLHLKDFSNLGTSVWGTRFLVLLGVAICFVGIRLLNMAIEINFLNFFKGAIPRWYGSTFFAEALVGVALMFFSALLIITTPPVEHPYFSKVAWHGFSRSELVYEEPSLFLSYRKGLNSFEPDSVLVEAENTTHGIGPLGVAATPKGGGIYALDKNVFALSGKWNLVVNAARLGEYDIADAFTLQAPEDFSLISEGGQRPFFNFFSLIMYAIAFAILIFGLVLFFLCRRALVR